MVAAGLERQKKMNNEANDQIRDTYMGKLGVPNNTTSTIGSLTDSETSSLRIASKEKGQKMSCSDTEDSKSMTATIDMNPNPNEKIQLD